MITAVPILLLILTTITLLTIRLLKPNFAYHWLVAVIGALLTWIIVLFSRSFLPVEISVLIWQTSIVPSARLFILMDPITWGFYIALATLLLSTLFTSAVLTGDLNQPKPSWLALIGSLGLIGVNLLAVAAGDLILIQITWVIAILFELFVWLPYISNSEDAHHLAAEMGMRFVSVSILGWATFQLISLNTPTDEFLQAPEIQPFLLLAAGFRLGVLPPFSSPTRNIPLPPSLESVIRLATCAPALVLLARSAQIGGLQSGDHLLLILSGIAALYGGLSLLTKSEEKANKSYWILAAGSLAVAGAALSLPDAAYSWGIAFLLAGGVLFQYTVRPRWLMPLIWAAALCLTSLVLTPTWPGTAIYTPPTFLSVFFLLSQCLMIAGYLSHASRPGPVTISAERWVWVVYFLGLALQPVLLIVISFDYYFFPITKLLARISVNSIIPGVIITLLSLVLFWIQRKRFPAALRTTDFLLTVFGLSWMYRLLRRFIEPFRMIFVFIDAVLEGQAGMIWSLLILVLLLTVLVQTNLGG